MNRPDIIFAADLHVTDVQPPCRTDYYWEAQHTKLDWIRGTCNKLHCPLVVAGDICDEPTPSYRVFTLLAQWLSLFEVNVVLVAGQHDMPYHRNASDRCALNALRYTKLRKDARLHVIMDTVVDVNPFDGTLLTCVPYGVEVPTAPTRTQFGRNVLVWHKMMCEPKADVVLLERANGTEAHTVFKQHPNYDLIVTGDNHRPFYLLTKQQRLVNCGSMMRRRADQAEHMPTVWGWNVTENELLPTPIPTVPGVVSREHIDVPAERDERLAAFVHRLDRADDKDLGDGFVENVLRLLEAVTYNKEPLRRYLRVVVAGKEPDYAD